MIPEPAWMIGDVAGHSVAALLFCALILCFAARRNWP
jgi:hypothetical protein